MNALQAGFYGLCGAGALPFATGRRWRPLRALCLFAAMNLALLCGFVRFAAGAQTGVWQRTSRARG